MSSYCYILKLVRNYELLNKTFYYLKETKIMSQNIFRNFENFWDKNDIKKKAESYQNYYKNNKDEDFSWINEKDKDSLKKINISKSMKWGIPNHILGDIDNSKFIIGLLNPGINMKQDEAENCNNVGEYIKKELKSEKKRT